MRHLTSHLPRFLVVTRVVTRSNYKLARDLDLWYDDYIALAPALMSSNKFILKQPNILNTFFRLIK